MKPGIYILVAILLVAIASFLALAYRAGEQAPAAADAASVSQSGGLPEQDRPPAGNAPLPVVESEERPVDALLVDSGEQMSAQWLQRASLALEQSRQRLEVGFELSPGQALALKGVFARRQQKLASLIDSMNSEHTGNSQELIRKISGLIRDEGLRRDLEGVLSGDQLQAYDLREAKRQRDSVEARAYRDLAGINAVVSLTDSQKEEVLSAFLESAPEKVAMEADARAFMLLTYGPMAATMDASYVRIVANMINMEAGRESNFNYDSREHQQWVGEQKKARIAKEVSALQGILNADQLDLYRKHLLAESP